MLKKKVFLGTPKLVRGGKKNRGVFFKKDYFKNFLFPPPPNLNSERLFFKNLFYSMEFKWIWDF